MALVPRSVHSVLIKKYLGSYTLYRSKLAPIERFASTETSPPVVTVNQDLEYEDEKQRAAAALELKRNKSRLSQKHFNLINGNIPVDLENPRYPYEQTVAFRQRMAARYGESTGIDFGICWPTKDQLKDMKEYESIAHPFTLQEMVEKKRKENELARAKIINRQKDIEMKMGKLAGWMKELNDRKAKKEAAAKAAQEKKDKLIEEVRQHFGYVVSMKDPKFQEMLEKKEKESKKAEKELKKKVKFDQATSKALAEANSSQQDSKTPQT